MIFVSAGTQLPFDRFIKILDDIARTTDEEIVAQAIPGQYEPNNFKLLAKIPTDQFNEYVDKARIVAAHAGMGCILTAMLKSKPIVIFPRLAQLGEHRNDHQTATARHFEEMGQVHVAWDEDSLRQLVTNNELKSLNTVGPDASEELRSFVENFIEKSKK